MGKQVYVMPGKKCRAGRVAILEEDALHPLDEVAGTHRLFVKCDDEEPSLAGMTALVSQKLSTQELRIVEDDAPRARKTPASDEGETATVESDAKSSGSRKSG